MYFKRKREDLHMKRRNVYLVSVAGVALVAGVIISTQLAKNNLYGYKTEGEYASIEAPAGYNGSTESDGYQVVIDEDIASKPIISEYTLDTLTENHLAIFNVAITGYPERIKSGSITIEQGDAEQNEYISIMVMENELPENGESLFVEWKDSTGYYDQFKDIEKPAEEKPAESNSNSNQQGSGESSQQGGGNSNQNSSQSSGGSSSSKPSGGTSTKPQPAPEQQQQQQEQQNSGGRDSIVAPELSEEEVSGRGGVAWDNGLWDDVE